MRECANCHMSWPEDRFNGRSDDCFKCRSKSIGVAFAGGRQSFHSETIKEYQTRAVREAKANGYDAVPVGTPSFAAGTGNQMAKLASVASKSVSQETV